MAIGNNTTEAAEIPGGRRSIRLADPTRMGFFWLSAFFIVYCARPGGKLRIDTHGAELDHLEQGSTLAHAGLGIKSRPIGIEPDGEHDQRNQGRRNDQPDQ